MLDLTQTRPTDDVAAGALVGGIGVGGTVAKQNPDWFDFFQLTFSEQVFLVAAIVGIIVGLIGIGKFCKDSYLYISSRFKEMRIRKALLNPHKIQK